VALLTDSGWAALPAPNVELLFSLVNQVGWLPRRPDSHDAERFVVEPRKGDVNVLPELGANHQPRPLQGLDACLLSENPNGRCAVWGPTHPEAHRPGG
jgi:hypothetical protein